MTLYQPGILESVPNHSRYLEFGVDLDSDISAVLKSFRSWKMDAGSVIGFGPAVLSLLSHPLEPLHSFPPFKGPGCNIPSTQADLWCWLRGEDRGRLVHQARDFKKLVEPAFRCNSVVDGFMYDESRDLSGYIDGTENPTGGDAVEVAIAQGLSPDLDGSSFVAVQHWVHDLDLFKAKPQAEQDDIFGRRLSDNEEFDEAPVSAHVKRTAQESFNPEAFMVRRSMPWADATGEGLVFVSFGKSLEAFESVFKRITGQEDGILDGLFNFTKPVTGSYFWCPPVKGGALNLSFLGL
jgi:porphyrinogen peroxidase